MLVIAARGEPLVRLLELGKTSGTLIIFELMQNEFEKLNYLELYILDFLITTKFGGFAKSIE